MTTPPTLEIKQVTLAGNDYSMAWPAMAMFEIADQVSGGDLNALSKANIGKLAKASARTGFKFAQLANANANTRTETDLDRDIQLASMDELNAILSMGAEPTEETADATPADEVADAPL